MTQKNSDISRPPYWSVPIEQLYNETSSSPQGLDLAAAAFLLKKYRPLKTLGSVRRAFFLLWQQLRNPLLLLLLLTCSISLAVGELADAIMMAFILAGSLTLSFLQEYRAAITNARLQKHLALKTIVIRSGTKLEIPSVEVVPGDVVEIVAGNLVPADGVIITSKDLHVNEGVLTGESLPTEKDCEVSNWDAPIAKRRNCVYMGTSVRSGSARVLVIHTGADTEFGAIALELQKPSSTTKFENGLRDFGLMLSRVMLAFLSLTVLVNVLLQRPLLETMLFALAISVGISPQLLPAILATTLSRGAQVMAKAGVLVKRMNAIENLGLMDVLCTDKTGTLTKGSMEVRDVTGLGGKDAPHLALYAYLNAIYQTGLANPLDDAILERFRSLKEEASVYKKIDELPLDFYRKRQTIVVRKNGSNLDMLICKGAVEKILEICSGAIDRDEVVPLSQTIRAEILATASTWAEQGVRVIGLALKEQAHKDAYRLEDEHSFVMHGFVLTADELRPETRETIKRLQELGVVIKIITGDNRFVSEAIARQVGFANSTSLTGEDIAGLSDHALWSKVSACQVFCEVDPHQKARIVAALQKTNHVVGFLGDGVNDAVALQAADVGISVQSAVDIARDSADLVLVDSGLGILYQGIIQGRTIFANTSKYILITSSANFGNMISMACASLFLPFLPLLPSQVLLNNFLTDFPSLMIGTDRIDADQLSRHQKWDISQVKKYMYIFGGLSSLIDGLTFWILLSFFKSPQENFRSGWFIVCVLTELLVIFVIRTPKIFYASRPSQSLILSSIFVGLTAISLPFTSIGRGIGLGQLSAFEVITFLTVSLGFLIAAEACKYLFLHQRKRAK